MKTFLAVILFALSLGFAGSAQAATCDVREYSSLAKVGNDLLQIPQEPAISHNVVTVGGVHAESTAFSSATRYVRTFCSVQACFEEGTNPVATTGSSPLPIGQGGTMGVKAGDKISVIACTP